MNTNHWRRALLCLAAVTALVATACGDGNERAAEAVSEPSTSTSATPATVPQTVKGDCVEGEECIEADAEPEIAEAPKVTTPEFVAFAAAADQVCATMAAKFEALPGIHSEDGSVAPGLGALMVEAAEALGEVEAPPSIAGTWDASLAAFAKTGETFAEAEQRRAAGDPEGAAEAENEVRWVLPVEHARLVASLGVPFQLCFVES
jgi:hypothetical protein